MVGLITLINLAKNQIFITKACLNQLIYFNKDIILLDTYKTNKLTRLLDFDCKIVKVYDNKDMNYRQYIDDIKNKIKENDINEVIIFRNQIMGNLKFDNMYLLEKFCTKIQNKKIYDRENYVSIDRLNIKFCFLIAFKELNISVKQIIIDLQEPLINNIMKFEKYDRYYFSKNTLGTKRIPMFLWYYNLKLKDVEIKDKKYDLFFMGTFPKSRENDVTYLSDLNDDRFIVKFLNGGMQSKYSEILTQEEYYDRLNQSKYTLIVPSYRKESFSIIRFFEAILNNCIPLIGDNVNLYELKHTFPDIYNIVIKYDIIVSYKDIKYKLKNRNYKKDKKIIDEVINSASFKKETDDLRLKKFYSKFL